MKSSSNRFSRFTFLLFLSLLVVAVGCRTPKTPEPTEPPPEAIKDLLPKLSELPRQAEEKAHTEAELRARLALARSLERHTWRLVLCDTASGKGLEEGLGFLADEKKEL
jgi:hypothetical protein